MLATLDLAAGKHLNERSSFGFQGPHLGCFEMGSCLSKSIYPHAPVHPAHRKMHRSPYAPHPVLPIHLAK